MTKVKFLADGDLIAGFTVSGHSSQSCEDTNGKIICSAVSSAVYMAANTLTEIIGVSCDIELDEAWFSLCTESRDKSAQSVLKGLKLHLSELSKQYPEQIKIITEV